MATGSDKFSEVLLQAARDAKNNSTFDMLIFTVSNTSIYREIIEYLAHVFLTDPAAHPTVNSPNQPF
jgi:hypothetical protein